MNLEKRIHNLEKDVAKRYIDPRVDAELTEWLKAYLQYNHFAQPENNNGIFMPERLNQALMCRMQKLFKERNLEPTLCNLLKIYEDLF